jgi:hypothetical protein
MGLDLTIGINNTLAVDYHSSVRVPGGSPIITWDFNQVKRSSIDEYTGVASEESPYGQNGYEIRISTFYAYIGTDTFIGNRIQTGFVSSQEKFWMYSGISLERGETYYGQIRVTDEIDRESDWYTFSFLYNSLPYVTQVAISPVSPSPYDDLEIGYVFVDDDGDLESGTIIRWYKNSVYQKQHDNATIISSYYLQNDDIWSVDVYPSDGYEYGERVSSPHVKVRKT